MFKKGFLVFSVISQMFLVGLLCYIICFQQSQSEMVADIFDNDHFDRHFASANQEQIPLRTWIKVEGNVEPKDGYVEMKSAAEGIVEDVFVASGASVKQGDALYKISNTKALLQLKESECRLAKAKAQLHFHKKPCKFSLLKKQNEIEEIRLQKAMDQKLFFAFSHLLLNKAASVFEKEETKIALAKTHNKLENACAEYKQMQEGISEFQEEVFNKEIELKETSLKGKILDLENCIVKAPFSGTVIDVKVRKGEFTFARDKKNILLANTFDKVIRVKIKQSDLGKIDLSKGLSGYAIAKQNLQKKISLKFLSCNPRLSVNKNGTRELEAIFTFKDPPFSIFLEQTFSVYIEAIR